MQDGDGTGGPPPGWYPDPIAPDLVRWWSGQGWTEHTKPAEGPVLPPALDARIDLAAPEAVPTRAAGTVRGRRVTAGEVLTALALLVVVIVATVSGGVGGLLMTTGLIGVLVGAYALIRGRSPMFRIRRRFAGLGVGAVAFVVLLTGSGVYAAQNPDAVGRDVAARAETHLTAPTVRATAKPKTPAAPGRHSALAVLATLPVKGKAPKTGYDRTGDFGPAWLDVDRNGCDTRNDILRRDLTRVTGSGCRVLTGTLKDPYTGSTIPFVRGQRTSAAVQIDHVVPLANAWQTGARSLSRQQRADLANDPINLFAVDGPTNEQKSDGDAATWLPKAKRFRCEYVAHQVGVKKAYRLWVTSAEKAAMQRVLTTCPSQVAPSSVTATLTPTLPRATPRTPEPAPTKATRTTKPGAYYADCSAVREAGRAPLHRGDAGYRSGLDRDGDGVACESRSGSSTSSGASVADTSAGAPDGATARCRDGAYSFSAHRSGTCSHHGGVATWL